ncbi:hypothetical protein SAMN05444671_3675 [Flavobacterium sp. CF108]|uniref:hypothetical protein n=1 Tax=unclassified Flavobacterium TaxID=196869 RepID=UPI0008CF43AE|nr:MULTISPECIES: hypothetical protein [unclassified Flavobacterium]SEO52262.1 hypothetical protein SAMN04487978_3109 [Flavobacterium sp. fv08]SHH74058.1 hypothetical protein SAMN05444671_3675 [Flavobacterium sp. CF108]
MKKFIKQIAAFALIAILASCDSADDNIEYSTAGGNAVPTTSSISRLDNNYNLPLNTYAKEGVTISKVEIYKNAAKTTSDPIVFGDKVADATLTDGKATFNTSSLGSFDVFPVTSGGTTTLTGKTGTYALAILSTYSDGTTTRATWTLTVGKGIVWQIYNADGDPVTNATSGVSTIKYLDPTPVIITFAPVKKASTTVNSIVGQWSKNGGAFSALPGTLPITHQDLDIAAIPYSTYGGIAVGDKITYRFTVTAGTQTDVISTTVEFVNQEFGADHDGSISNAADSNSFDFSKGTTGSEISFVSPFGITAGATSGITFVKSTLDFDTADLFDADAAYTAGAKVTSLTNLATGDVIIYKITRDGDDYYGILKVTDKIQGTTSQELQFSYKEGILLQ